MRDFRGISDFTTTYLTISVCNVLLLCVFRGTAFSPSPPRLWRTSCLCCVPGASLLPHPRKSPRILGCSKLPCGAWLQWSTFCTPAAQPRGRWRSGQYWIVTSSCSTGTGHQTASREICRTGRITSLPFSNICWVREYLPSLFNPILIFFCGTQLKIFSKMSQHCTPLTLVKNPLYIFYKNLLLCSAEQIKSYRFVMILSIWCQNLNFQVNYPLNAPIFPNRIILPYKRPDFSLIWTKTALHGSRESPECLATSPVKSYIQDCRIIDGNIFTF